MLFEYINRMDAKNRRHSVIIFKRDEKIEKKILETGVWDVRISQRDVEWCHSLVQFCAQLEAGTVVDSIAAATCWHLSTCSCTLHVI